MAHIIDCFESEMDMDWVHPPPMIALWRWVYHVIPFELLNLMLPWVEDQSPGEENHELLGVPGQSWSMDRFFRAQFEKALDIFSLQNLKSNSIASEGPG